MKQHRTWGFDIYLDENESGMMKMRTTESYEVEKFKWMIDNLRPEDTFVDVGANKGDFTLHAASRCQQVISIEPHPNNITWLRKSITLNGFENVKVIEGCATNAEGKVQLGEGSKSGYHSIVAKRQTHLEVEGFRLDAVLDQKNIVMKIDVEGAELLVLEGCQGILDNCRAFLIDVDSGDFKAVNAILKDFTQTYRRGKELFFAK